MWRVVLSKRVNGRTYFKAEKGNRVDVLDAAAKAIKDGFQVFTKPQPIKRRVAA